MCEHFDTEGFEPLSAFSYDIIFNFLRKSTDTDLLRNISAPEIWVERLVFYRMFFCEQFCIERFWKLSVFLINEFFNYRAEVWQKLEIFAFVWTEIKHKWDILLYFFEVS